MANKVRTLGTTLQCQFSGSTWTTVAQIAEIDGFDMSVETEDSTDLSSTARTHEPTLPDFGTLSGKLRHDPDDSTHQAMVALIASPARKNWRVNYTDSTPTVGTFNGSLVKYKIGNITPTGFLEAEFEIKANGPVTFA